MSLADLLHDEKDNVLGLEEGLTFVHQHWNLHIWIDPSIPRAELFPVLVYVHQSVISRGDLEFDVVILL